MKRKYSFFIVLLFILTLSAVSDRVAVGNIPNTEATEAICSTLEPTVFITPSPAPTASPVTETRFAEDENGITRLFYELLNGKTCCIVSNPDTEFLTQNTSQSVQSVLSRRETYTSIAQQLTSDAVTSAEYCAEALQDTFCDTVFSYSIETEIVGWKYVGSMLWLMPSDITYRDFYDILLTVDRVESKTDFSQSVAFTVSVRAKSYYDNLLSIVDGNRDYFMTADYIMAYTTTVYDEWGEETDYIMPSIPEGYFATLHKPLDGSPVFYDRWYEGRSHNSRKHTGLDLHARKNANIYSCTDGTVLFVGFRSTPGYYVVIRDCYGYIYHYYHMSKLSDFLTEGQSVSAGDCIGYVGNTGNSDVNHLHLGLVTPDCRYVRLYDIMRELYGEDS